MTVKLTSYFAPSERASRESIERDVAQLALSPLVSGLMHAASGLLIVLNEQRQIVAVNEAFLRSLHIAEPAQTMGLRLGETLGCIHAHEMPAGCGTSRYCASCGAAIAMIAARSTEQPQERDCIATVRSDSGDVDLCLNVKVCPERIEGRLFLLVFLQDVTSSKRWAQAQRGLLGEVGDLVHELKTTTDSLSDASAASEPHDQESAHKLATDVQCMSTRLAHELSLQRMFLDNDPQHYELLIEELDARDLLRELATTIASHPAARAKTITSVLPQQPVRLRTDRWLLGRVLSSMLTNALEAMAPGDEAKLAVVVDGARATISVWNRQTMPASVALRMFERHHSTKEGLGRGLGSYSMKLIGERLLGGNVDFTTSAAEGTSFRISLPLAGD